MLYVVPFKIKLPVIVKPLVILTEPVINVFELIDTFVPSSEMFESPRCSTPSPFVNLLLVI